MQTVGILIIAVGVWIIYCAVTGISPWQTALAVIQNPDKASQIIADAKDKAAKDIANKGADTLTTAIGKLLPTVNPFLAFPVSDGFGARGGEHKGIDYMMPVGTPLVAASDGVVHFSTSGGTGGWIATITTDNGYKLLYMHCSKFRTELEGKRVTYGTVIAYSGGAAGAQGAGDSTGPHLHFQVNNPQGTPIDPKTYFGMSQLDKNLQQGPYSNITDPNATVGR